MGVPIAPPPRNGAAGPPNLAHVHCGQTAGWIEMKFGMWVRLAPSNFVLDVVLITPPPPPPDRLRPSHAHL